MSNNIILSSLGNLTLNDSLVVSADISSGIDESMLSNYFDKRLDNVICGNVKI